uniref:Uncharacterized protein LOC100366718 n=1 Tax=Saccoglossus kowalevskii TaxID=10224 RepID=A0ABM0GVK3_SACKO|nr:PREDICTED: uncharacterized protein LOC100366718 [Saccoglossus kowalevskii]
MLLVEIDNLRMERDEAREEIARLKKRINQLEKCSTVSSNSVAESDCNCNLMTGLSWAVFLQLFAALSVSFGEFSCTRDSLPLREQFFITLIKLRHGVTFDFLAHIRGCPKSTVINYFWKWTDLIHSKLGFMVQWPTRENIFNKIPPIFKKKFPRLTSIIDCFEIFIDAPKTLLARAQCYSSYKKHTTVKVFISCSPLGQINFISSAWGGRVSDVHLVRESGFISPKLHFPEDQILADRGFTLVEDFATSCSAHLIIPAFTKGKLQLSAEEVENSRKISSVRIHIERVIGNMKNRYTILQGPLPIRMIQSLKNEAMGAELASIDKLVKVCAVLTNMGGSIVYAE